MSGVDLLGDVICHGGKVRVAALGQERDIRALLSRGLLQEAGVASSVVCMDCEVAHAAEVIFDQGTYGHFCPDLGFVKLDRQDISTVEPDLRTLIAHLAEAFDCSRRKVTPVHGNTWRIGAVKTEHGDITLYFHPRLRDEEDARELADALSREIASAWRIVVTACGLLPVSGAATVTLNELVETSLRDKCLIPARDLRSIVSVPAPVKIGSPNRFRDMCLVLIRSRIASETALVGRNEEAKAVHALLEIDLGPDAPSLATVMRYVTEGRTG